MLQCPWEHAASERISVSNRLTDKVSGRLTIKSPGQITFSGAERLLAYDERAKVAGTSRDLLFLRTILQVRSLATAAQFGAAVLVVAGSV
jgi:hypothetical protein